MIAPKIQVSKWSSIKTIFQFHLVHQSPPLNKSTLSVQYLMFRLMCAGLEVLFLLPVREEEGAGLWFEGLEWGLDMDCDGGGCAGVSADGEVDG